MKKRVISILLCAALALPVAVSPALAKAEDVPQKEKAAVLRELEVMVGDETGELHLERGVTRSEFTKLLIAASPYKDAVGESANTDPYPDVSFRSWYAPYVRAAVDAGLVKGDEQGWFHPMDPITLQEGATMAVRLLGYQDGDFNAPWPAGQMALYRSLELDAGVSAQTGADLLTRQDCLHLFYNLLCAPTKNAQSYVNLLGHTLDQNGEVDVAALFQVEQEGPVPLTVGWEYLIPFPVDDALVYRDGERAELSELREWDLVYWAKDQAILFAVSQGTMGQLAQSLEGPIVVETSLWDEQLPFPLSEVQQVTRDGQYANRDDIQYWDVVYWSKYTKSLHVYSTRVHGFIEDISPSLAAPAAVTVAGRTYPLETLRAQYELSDFSYVSKGDQVTLLLGRTGGVAAVMAGGGAGQSGETASTQPTVGVVTALTTQSYTDSANDPYATKAVSVTTTAGDSRTYSFDWDEDVLKLGDLVRVEAAGGKFQVSKLAGRSLSGTVNGRSVGGRSIAQNAEIIETWGDLGARSVPLARLDGVTLSADKVRYYETDAQGTVTRLVLRDVTGDGHSYGVLLDAAVADLPSSPISSMVLQSVYTIDIGGRQQTIPLSGKRFPVQKGPFCLVMDGQEVETMRSLTKLSDITLSGSDAVSGKTTYPLADNTAYYIYNKRQDTYTLASRSQVLAEDYVLSAWYDALPSQGGRVRVILAQER